MKAITIWQPWASLLASGGKMYETRPWETSYRGPIAIHAAKLSVRQVLKKCFPLSECDYSPDHRAKVKFLDAAAKGFGGVYTTEEILGALNDLPTGAVIATAELVNIWRIVRNLSHDLDRGAHKIGEEDRRGNYIITSELELALGDWTPGRFAWEFSNMKMIAPVQVSGKQMLWEWGGA